MGHEVLWFDCETGGADDDNGPASKVYALTQVSAMIEIDGEIVDEIDLKMRPYGKRIVTPKALEIQGRTMEEVEAFELSVFCYEKFKKFLARRPAVKTNRYIMAGYNPDFDCKFIYEWFFDMSVGPYEFWKYMQFSPVDLLGILRAMRHFKIINIPDTKLKTVCDHFGVTISAHDSMSDIRATREVANLIMREIKDGWSVLPADIAQQ
jgi:DNA polymerase III epsilon subunit-like protein